MPQNNDPIFFPKDISNQKGKDTFDVKRLMAQAREDCLGILEQQWSLGDIDQRAALGDSTVWSQIYSGNNNWRDNLSFNLIAPSIQSISGYQRRTRKSVTVTPLSDENQKTADQLTKILFNITKDPGAYQAYSDAFEHGALTQGLGFLSIYIDYSDDPISGDIKVRYLDFKSCMFDPFFKQKSMEDARFFWTRHFFNKTQAKSLYPKFAEQIENSSCTGYKDDKFFYIPETQDFKNRDTVVFDEYWYKATRKANYLIDVDSEEVQEYPGSKEDFQEVLYKKPDLIGRFKFVNKTRPTVRRALLINNEIVEDGANPYDIDCYPFVPVLGYFCPHTTNYAFKFKGLVRDLLSPQYLFNRLKIANLNAVESQQQGIKMIEGALVDAKDSLNQGAGKVLSIKRTHSMSDVERFAPIPLDPSLIGLEESLKKLVYDLSISEEMLGIADDDKAGILSMIRQNANMTRVQIFLDNASDAQLQVGKIKTLIIQKKYTIGKVRKLINEEPTEEFETKLFMNYNFKMSQNVLTETQEQLEAQQLIYARSVLGMPVNSKRILRKLNLQDKDEVVQEVIEAEEAQAQAQQKMQELQMRELQVDNETKLAYSDAQRSLSKERMAKINLDQTLHDERLAKAKEDRAGATLDIIKSLREMEAMDTEDIVRGTILLKKLDDALSDSQNNIQNNNLTKQGVGRNGNGL